MLQKPPLAALALILSGCAVMAVVRPAPGVLAQGTFTPQRPAAASYGADPLRVCPVTGTLPLLLAELSKPGNAPGVTTDGRLCAAAEAWLGWPQPNPPESVKGFVAAWFGLPNPQTRIVLDTVETDDDGDLFVPLVAPVIAFAKTATAPRIGLATMLVKGSSQMRAGDKAKGTTKLVLLMQDAALDLDPLPRQLPLGGQASLSGRFPGALVSPRVIFCDSEGKLSALPATPGKEFKTELRCGSKPGRIEVEIRGDNNGAPAIAAAFSVACGGAVPGSFAVPAGPATADPATEELRLLNQVNGERAALGLPALIAHEGLGKLARSISEREGKELARGAHYAIVPTEELRKAGISTPMALFNPPAAARNVDEALGQLASSPVLRCNALSAKTTHAGFGIAPGTAPDGTPLVLVTETFIEVLPPVDPVALRGQVRDVVLAKRAAILTSKSTSDAALEQVAQRYAEALAESGGKLDNTQSNALISPLYKGYKNLEINPAAQNDALVFANDPGLLGKGNALGVGLALGDHPQLGKNAVYLVVLIATKR